MGKVVEGKKLRKKIKVKKSSPPANRQRSMSPGKRSDSPRLRMGGSRGGGVRSPGRRYFSPGRGRDAKLSPRRRNRSISMSPESKRKGDYMKRSPIPAKSRERSSK